MGQKMNEVPKELVPEAYQQAKCSPAKASLLNLNGNVLCAVSCETTGLRAGFHDLIQICVLPLDNELKPQRGIIPFYVDVKPRRPENCQKGDTKVNRTRLCQIMLNGLDADKAADLFDEWALKLKLGHEKRISPISSKWPLDRDFMIDWMGRENFEYNFDARYRDTQAAALYMNDRADFQVEQIQFGRVGLTSLANRLHVERDIKHDALQDCLVIAECYRKMVKM
jgi:DNA polymerase III epsilon subunit-like protein